MGSITDYFSKWDNAPSLLNTDPVQEITWIEDIRAGLYAIWGQVLKVEGFGRSLQEDADLESTVNDEIDSLLYYRGLSCWYDTSRDDIEHRKAFLCDFVQPYFRRKTLQRSIIPTDSFLPGLIDQTALLYKDQAERWIEGEEANNTYLSFTEGIHKKAKEWHKRLKLYNLVAVRPVVRERKKKGKVLEYDIVGPDKFRALYDENGDVEKLVVYGGMRTINDLTQHVLAVWTDSEHYILDVTGKRIEMPDNEDGTNPYGEIPYVLMNLYEADDPYSGGAYDAMRANMRVNFLELLEDTDATYAAINIGVATNCELGPNPVVGPRDLITANNVKQGEQETLPPSLEYISGTPHSELLRALGERKEIQIKMRHHLSPAMLSEQVATLSGVALAQMYRPLLEQRENEADIMRVNETNLYEMTATVLEVEGLAKLPKDGFNIDFAEVVFNDDPDKEFARRLSYVEKNLWSWADLYRTINTDLDDDEEIMARLEENRMKNMRLERRVPGFAAKLLTKPEPKVTDGNTSDSRREVA